MIIIIIPQWYYYNVYYRVDEYCVMIFYIYTYIFLHSTFTCIDDDYHITSFMLTIIPMIVTLLVTLFHIYLDDHHITLCLDRLMIILHLL